MAEPADAPDGSPSDDDLLRGLLERWYAIEDSGERPDLDGVCADHPHLRHRLAALVAGGDVGPASIAESAPPLTGFGDFRLLRELGRGGMGTVYLAEQASLGRLVALKVLHDEAAANEVTRRRFLREATIMAALEHPNIVAIHAVGEADGRSFIAMAHVDGANLGDLEPRPSPRQTARIGARVARALAEAHASGVIHRDVKPSNIVMRGDEPVLLDFGLARDDSAPSLTASHAIPGTLLYMAPEHLAGDRTLDARTDVYGLGATLYQVVSGRLPFTAESAEGLVHDILLRDPDPLELAGDDRALDVIIRRALEKERHLRFPSALDMALDLERYLAGEDIESRPSGVLRRAMRVVRRHRRAAVVLMVMAVFSIGLAIAIAFVTAREERDFEESVRRVDAALASSDVRGAELLLASFAPRRRSSPAVVLRTRRVTVRRLLDDVEDRIFDLSFERDPSPLAGLVARIEELGSGAQPPSLDLVRAFSCWVRRDVAGARTVAERARDSGRLGRPAAAMLRLIRGEEPSDELPDVGSGPPDDVADEHVFTAIALYLADRPLEEIWDEAQRGWLASPGHYGVRFTRGRLLDLQSRIAESYEAFATLTRHGEQPRRVRRIVARLALALGRDDVAHRLAAAMPYEPDDVGSVELAIDLASADADAARRAALLDDALARWPEDAPLRTLRAEILIQGGDLLGAAEQLVVARRSVTRRSQAARCDVLRLTLDFRALVGDDGVLQAGDRPRLAGLDAEAFRVFSGLSSPDARAALLMLRAQMAGLRGDLTTFWNDAERAFELAQAPASGALQYARTAVGPFLAGVDALADARRRSAQAFPVRLARRTLDRLLDPTAPRPASVTATERREAHWLSALLAFILVDDDAFERHAGAFSELATDGDERRQSILDELGDRL